MIGMNVKMRGTSVLTFDKKGLKKTLRKVGNEVAAAAKQQLRSTSGSGRTYYNSGGNVYGKPYITRRYRASGPGQAPVKVTGNLVKKIKVRVFKSGEGVAIRDNAFYSAALEKGAAGGGKPRGARGSLRGRMRKLASNTARILRPRPFLSKALESRASSIQSRLKASIEQGIEFVPAKGKRR